MLRIISGKAGTGKSAAIMNEIARGVSLCEGGYILLVPEQYSHEAERELCSICGDSLSLYAEVLSFTGLARKVSAILGGGAAQYLDSGGRLLCMALASDGLHSRLRVYSEARRKAELQAMLLSTVDELKTACISAQQLIQASSDCEGSLSDKLHDLAIILEAYDAVVANGYADPTDRLTVLAQKIGESQIAEGWHVYIDGFTDFTAQEKNVVFELLLSGADITVCVGCDDLNSGSEVFELGRKTARALIAFAKDNGIEVKIEKFTETAGKCEALSYFADNMFTFSSRECVLDGSAITVNSAANLSAECEFAAAKAIELVRDTGCRWRDIAIAVRGFDDYRLSLESAFKHYSVPLYASRKSDLLSKPLPALIYGAYEIIGGGWELGDVISYLRTGLAGLSESECDELENYAFLWQLRGSAWTQNEPWHLHPDGYGAEYDDETNTRLDRINLLRNVALRPLKSFAEKSENAQTAGEQAGALAALLEELKVSEKLAERAQKLIENGEGAKAQEYAQLWDICANALEQCAAILGDTETDRDAFGRLFTMTLSKYDVGTIPASLDRVVAGDFDRMRRRRIKHLIVLGASDSRLPKSDDEGGMFSSDERKKLLEMDIDLGAGECELWREFSLIYNCLTLPSETLSFCYPAFDNGGEACRPAFVVSRAKTMFGLETKSVELPKLRMNAAAPALELAANGMRGTGEIEVSAAEFFNEKMPEKMSVLRAAAEKERGSLSAASVQSLYGKNIKLSASRIDKFASCRFAYFMQYGLKAKPRQPAGFTPPEMGIFMHYILEHVAGEVTEKGGFKAVDDAELKAITDKYISEYIRETLNDFREKSERFKYLFRRLAKDVHRVVGDLAAEMRVSDFVPLSFELDFGKVSEIPPVRIGDGEESLELKGVVDRVDGWVHDDKLYLRVVDYKTGKKSFSLADVLYGMNLQMLLYLFALGKNGEKLYGKQIVPAGVLYVPAHDVFVSANADMSDEELRLERSKGIKRSGLLLDEPAVISAMESGEKPKYIPVKFKDGAFSGDALASAERLGVLSRHIDETLGEMAKQLKRGSIAADPFYRTQQENACLHCDYLAACRFKDGENGERMRTIPRLAATKVWSILEGGEADG